MERYTIFKDGKKLCKHINIHQNKESIQSNTNKNRNINRLTQIILTDTEIFTESERERKRQTASERVRE